MTGNRLNLADQISYPRVNINDTSTAISPRFSVAAVRTLTAPRALTLPAANAYPPDLPLHVVDESGLVNPTNTVTINAAGSDGINGLASIVSKTPYFSYAFHSDGVSKWTIRHFGLASLGNDPNYSLSGNTALTQAQADNSYIRRKNFIYDPGFRFSQENGYGGLVTNGTGGAFWVSDSMLASRSGGGAVTAQRIASPTPGGSFAKNTLAVTTTNPSPGTSDYLLFQTRMEGQDVAPLQFGTAAARKVMIRFGCNISVPGNYAICIRNGPSSRSYVTTYNISSAEAGNNVVKTVVIPGDTGGTWPTDRSYAMQVNWTFSAGSSNVASTPNTWLATGAISVAGATNLMSVANATAVIFDVALWDVTGLNDGVIPQFEYQDMHLDYIKCQQYVNIDTVIIGPFYLAPNTSFAWPFSWAQTMRITPTLIINNVTSPQAGSINVLSRTPNYGSCQMYSAYSGQDNAIAFGYSAFARIQ